MSTHLFVKEMQIAWCYRAVEQVLAAFFFFFFFYPPPPPPPFFSFSLWLSH